MLAVGAGLCINNTLAVLSGLSGSTGEFRRTPKHRVQHSADPVDDNVYRARRAHGATAELALGCWAFATCGLSAWLGLPLTALFHALFASGLLWVGFHSLAEEQAGTTRIVAAS